MGRSPSARGRVRALGVEHARYRTRGVGGAVGIQVLQVFRVSSPSERHDVGGAFGRLRAH